MLRRQQNDIGSLVAPYSASPPGRPWVFGELGDLASLRAQYRANEARYEEIKRAAQPLIAAHPFSPTGYTELAHRLAGAPRSAVVSISQGQFANLTRAVLSVTSSGQVIAAAMLSDGRRPEQTRKILFAVKDALDTYDRMLQGIYTISRQAGVAARAVGLGEPLTTGAIIALVIAVAVIAVAGVLLYALLASLQAASAAWQEADHACARDAAAGRPCSGAQWEEYHRRAQEAQREWGVVPDIAGLLRQFGSLIFWGGLLAIGAALGYAAWTAEPARRNVQERLRTASMNGLGRGRRT